MGPCRPSAVRISKWVSLNAVLKEQAHREHISVAEIVRRAVDAWCRSDRQRSDTERRQAALAVVGRFASGHHDVAGRHDDHLAEAFEK